MPNKIRLMIQTGWTSLTGWLPWVRARIDHLLDPSLMPRPRSADYRAWQQHFFLGRLKLCLQLAIIILLSFIGRDLYNLFFPLAELQTFPHELLELWLPIDLAILVGLSSCLWLHGTEVGRRHPALLFLGLSWSVNLIPQILATLKGYPLPTILAWSLLFLIQATLIPVRWQLHLLSQVGLLAYFYGVNSLLGLTSVPQPFSENEQSIFASTVILYLFWFCFICDLAVYLYERLQRAEFASQRQAQIFFHAVSHDLRNPVTGTSLVLNKLLKQPEDTIVVPRSLIERMVDSHQRQLDLINSLLEAHSSDLQGLVLQPEPQSLTEVVAAAIADLEPLLEANNTTLETDISTALPLVQVDATQIWRVLTNLIANALHHNPPGLTVTLSATVEAPMVRCSVQDNGIGMPPEQRDRIFDLYVRRSRTQQSLSLGLGLYLCRQIIQAHGGKIGVFSEPHAGATFWFTLPIAAQR